jgi:predicted nucleic acid-binding protein
LRYQALRVLVDTNVIIDILSRREPFFEDSYRFIQLALWGRLEAFMSAGAVTDVYYIICRSLHNARKAREHIIGLGELVSFCDTTAGDIHTALSLSLADFEDAVIAAIAKREKADYIVTRNESDFGQSPVPAISPARFLDNTTNIRVMPTDYTDDDQLNPCC